MHREITVESIVRQEQVVVDCTQHKSVPAKKQANRESTISSLLVTMEWCGGQAGWDKFGRELVRNTKRSKEHALRDGLVVELVE